MKGKGQGMAKKFAPSFQEADDNDVQAGPSVIAIPAALHRDRRGDLLLSAHVELTTVDEFTSEIERLWSEAQERFLEIGRYLLEAKERLPHGEFGPMIDARLPFGARVAQKLMQVAQAVEDRMFPPELLPSSYNTVYELVTLKSYERDLALKENIVRPNVRRGDVIDFKRRIRAKPAMPVAEREALRRRLARLTTQRKRLDDEITGITARLGDTLDDGADG